MSIADDCNYASDRRRNAEEAGALAKRKGEPYANPYMKLMDGLHDAYKWGYDYAKVSTSVCCDECKREVDERQLVLSWGMWTCHRCAHEDTNEQERHDLALAYLRLFPNLKQGMSLDEFLILYKNNGLTDVEWQAGSSILSMID